jgi:hypothetical protein
VANMIKEKGTIYLTQRQVDMLSKGQVSFKRNGKWTTIKLFRGSAKILKLQAQVEKYKALLKEAEAKEHIQTNTAV